jgi:ribosomal protein S18 acetylase RimI-like enzyme
MTASTTIRSASVADAERLTDLFHAMYTHYWGPGAPSRADIAEHISRDVLPSGCEVIIAECDERAVGLATFAVLYPGPGIGGQLTMKDLFVVGEVRGRGVGKALLSHLAKIVVERGCLRLDWTAETSNPEALDYYDRLGVQRVREKIYYRLDGEALKDWAGTAKT